MQFPEGARLGLVLVLVNDDLVIMLILIGAGQVYLTSNVLGVRSFHTRRVEALLLDRGCIIPDGKSIRHIVALLLPHDSWHALTVRISHHPLRHQRLETEFAAISQ